MKEKSENKYVRRTSKDYSMPFKMQVVREVESGELRICAATRKYGIQIYNQQRPHLSCYMRTPEQMHSQSQTRIKTYKKTNRIRANLDAVR